MHVDELARLRGEAFDERVQQRRKAAALLVELVVVAPGLLHVGRRHGEEALSERAVSHCQGECPLAQMQRLEGDLVVRPLPRGVAGDHRLQGQVTRRRRSERCLGLVGQDQRRGRLLRGRRALRERLLGVLLVGRGRGRGRLVLKYMCICV